MDPRDASCVPVFFRDESKQMTDSTPSVDARHRVRVFVDFWNIQVPSSCFRGAIQSSPFTREETQIVQS